MYNSSIEFSKPFSNIPADNIQIFIISKVVVAALDGKLCAICITVRSKQCEVAEVNYIVICPVYKENGAIYFFDSIDH